MNLKIKAYIKLLIKIVTFSVIAPTIWNLIYFNIKEMITLNEMLIVTAVLGIIAFPIIKKYIDKEMTKISQI